MIIDLPGGPDGPQRPGEPPLGPDPNPQPGDGGDSTQPPTEMVEIELIDGHIVNMAATTFWGPDGKPMSAKDFIERMFGELPDLFKDKDELRALWGDPDTRKALIERLAERGYDALVLMQIRTAIMAEKSDLFDVLAYVAYASEPMTRAERANRGAEEISQTYDDKLAAFLHYVLGQYVETGVEDLDRSKLPDYLKIKFGTFADGARQLGGAEIVAGAFVGFQKHLYLSV